MDSPPLDVLWRIVAQQHQILLWTIFAVLHLILAVVVLFVFWYFEISAHDIVGFLRAVYHSKPFAVLSILGIGLLSILKAYFRVYKTISRKSSSWFLWKPLYDEAKKNS